MNEIQGHKKLATLINPVNSYIVFREEVDIERPDPKAPPSAQRGFYLRQSLIFRNFASQKLNMAISKKGKALLNFIIFICFTAVYGAIIALINNWFRTHGIEKAYITPLLIFSTVFVYLKAWQWLCRKLDISALDKN